MVHLPRDPRKRLLFCCGLIPVVTLLCIIFFIRSSLLMEDYEKISRLGSITANQTYRFMQAAQSEQIIKSNLCTASCEPSGSEVLPKGIVSRTTNLEMRTLSGTQYTKEIEGSPRSLLAMAVGIKQKQTVDQIVKKFLSCKFTVMLFHYDGIVDEWNDFDWSRSVIHVSAVKQTKWWFAKRFLHPDIVSEYKYIFLWDEDVDVENFHPRRYLEIVQNEGLEISQPALDATKSEVHHQITVRNRRTKVHRRIFKFAGRKKCDANSIAPPCTGWVEMMAPVFSRASWRCTWYMIQNDLIHAWGLDMKLGYCAQGDRTEKVGVVDAEYIVHKAIPSLGYLQKQSASGEPNSSLPSKDTPKTQTARKRQPPLNDRLQVRFRSYKELNIFRNRWNKAVDEDKCWQDPYPEPTTKTS